ncbi:hypothetical protein BH11PSE2_BH11PSE2_07480 [soil metagenome]
MRKLIFALGALLAATATPVLADTLQELTTHGMIMTVQDMDFEVTYTPDGKFTAFDGQITGTWKIDGDKLCTTSNFQPEETCAVYPKDKKSGDTFELTTPEGSVKIKIK